MPAVKLVAAEKAIIELLEAVRSIAQGDDATLAAQRDVASQELEAALVTASKLVDPAPPEPVAGEAEPVGGA